MHWRYRPDYTRINQFAQPIYREDTVGICTGIARIVMKMIYSQVACLRVTWNLTEASVTVWVEHIVRRLTLQMHACCRDQCNTAIRERLAQRCSESLFVSCNIGSPM